uniref:NET domain-containing protein n=1 Tax=viral metagenome TaxID=1070528 RepID=A0A6C0AWJ2_9ZZZZ|tara:strand:- start:4001 stop:4324 length:324 start_codon:yes stop_codon:yes gene_type:complete
MEKIQLLEYIRQQVELMSKHNQIEVLRLLNESEEIVTLNENNYGIFVNLSDLSDNLLEKINNYIEYWKKQEHNLKHIEHKKQTYKTIFFSNNIKDNSKVYNNAEQSI